MAPEQSREPFYGAVVDLLVSLTCHHFSTSIQAAMSSFTYPSYSNHSYTDADSGPPVIWIAFVVLVIFCSVMSCLLRCGNSCNDDETLPPPVQIIGAPEPYNVYPNHTIDMSQGYVIMATTPQYEVPMAVIVEPSAPPTTTTTTTCNDTYSATTTS